MNVNSHTRSPPHTAPIQVVWPHAAGEVIVQNYNAILSLSRIYEASDAVIVASNDEAHQICVTMHHLKVVSMYDINKVLARDLANVFRCSNPSACPAQTGVIGDLLAHLVSHTHYKLLTIHTVPQMPDTYREFTTYQWTRLLKPLSQMVATLHPCEEV